MVSIVTARNTVFQVCPVATARAAKVVSKTVVAQFQEHGRHCHEHFDFGNFKDFETFESSENFKMSENFV